MQSCCDCPHRWSVFLACNPGDGVTYLHTVTRLMCDVVQQVLFKCSATIKTARALIITHQTQREQCASPPLLDYSSMAKALQICDDTNLRQGTFKWRLASQVKLSKLIFSLPPTGHILKMNDNQWLIQMNKQWNLRWKEMIDVTRTLFQIGCRAMELCKETALTMIMFRLS